MSFLSVEPQSRVLLENYSNSLLVQFDTQLGVIADRYLAFFQERRSIEATYIESLRNLHYKTKTVDASFDPKAEPTTTRAAWEKVRDNLEREANTQQAFVDILDNDVIQPLITLKETKDQTGKWIEEDLKESAAEYADHAENAVAKLQQAYFKKHHPRFGRRTSTLSSGRQEDLQESEPAKSEEVSDDDCRRAIRLLNNLRFMRVETLEDGYDCLEELVFTPVIKNVLAKYMNGMVTARTLHDDLAMITRADVEKALAQTDTSNLKASFRQALSFSIPPITLYRNYRPSTFSDSDMIFGVPLVDLTTNRDNVPQVMRMCIEEVEKRGLNISKIYSVDHPFRAEVLQFRRRFESEKSFSFSSADNIHSVAMLLMLYLLDLPEPLFILSLQDYRNYGQNRARYAKNGFSLLRSKIRELPPVQRASLEALLRHLLRVSSHSDKNGMTVKSLAANFRYAVLRGNEVLQDGVSVKGLVLEDLIQNAQALFDKRSPPTPPRPVPSPRAAETTSTFTHSSFLSPESSQSAEAQAAGSTTRHPSTPTQSSFSPSPSDPHAGRRPAPTVPPARHTSWASLLKGANERSGDVNARPGDT